MTCGLEEGPELWSSIAAPQHMAVKFLTWEWFRTCRKFRPQEAVGWS